jgi:hypothetical protein
VQTTTRRNCHERIKLIDQKAMTEVVYSGKKKKRKAPVITILSYEKE